jgi:hypothetical protein
MRLLVNCNQNAPALVLSAIRPSSFVRHPTMDNGRMDERTRAGAGGGVLFSVSRFLLTFPFHFPVSRFPSYVSVCIRSVLPATQSP